MKNGKPKKGKKYRKKERKDRNLKKKIETQSTPFQEPSPSVVGRKKVNGNKFKKIQNKFICHKTNLI